MTERERWQNVWHGLGAAGERADAAFDEIVLMYSDRQRAYHNLEHIRRCLRFFDEIRSLFMSPAEVEAALWLHDVVHVPAAADNEERSAAWADKFLTEGGIAPAVVATICELILTTQHAAPPKNKDAALLVDIDLSILGSAEEEFDLYEEAIWRECPSAPNFRKRRLCILRSFLDREFIFATPEFRQRFEEQARANLLRAVRRLKRS